MKTFALCAGYGGLEMALRAAGQPVELIAYAETDPAAAGIMFRDNPDVPNLGDIRDLPVVAGVERVTAGFPCQPISAAGAQRPPRRRAVPVAGRGPGCRRAPAG